MSNTGTWIQRVAQDWLVLTLTPQRRRALGVVTALQVAADPALLRLGRRARRPLPQRAVLEIMAGELHRRARGASWALTVSGDITVWQIYAFALLLGTVTAADTPARQSFVVEMVGQDDLQNAVSLNSANFNLARVVGPAVAGLFIGLFASEVTGTGSAFLVDAVSSPRSSPAWR